MARPYARAAFASACAHNETEAWRNALAALSALALAPGLRAVLHGPKRLSSRIADESLDALGLQDESVNERIRNFVRLLATRRRLPLLAEISRLFASYEADAAGREQVKVTTARALDKKARAKLEDVLRRRLGRAVDATYDEDETLMAGALVRAGDRVMDNSLKSRLEGLTAALKQ